MEGKCSGRVFWWVMAGCAVIAVRWFRGKGPRGLCEGLPRFPGLGELRAAVNGACRGAGVGQAQGCGAGGQLQRRSGPGEVGVFRGELAGVARGGAGFPGCCRFLGRPSRGSPGLPQSRSAPSSGVWEVQCCW